MSMFSKMMGWDREGLPSDARMGDALNGASGAAGGAESRFLNDYDSFDPGAALDKYAQGSFGKFKTNMGLELRKLAGSSVGAGRLDTGFFDEDQGQVVKDMSQQFTNDLNTRALDVAGMKQRGIEMMGNYSMGRNDQFLSLLSGQMDREQGALNARKQAKGGFINGLIGAAGSVAGAMVL